MAASRICHSDEEWMELIMECRSSGMSDVSWCRQNSIPASTFYNAVSRLRKKACSIPGPLLDGNKGRTLDLTSSSQDVVPIRIEPETSPATELASVRDDPAQHFDNSYRIEVLLDGTSVRISNGADPALLSSVLSAIRRKSC